MRSQTDKAIAFRALHQRPGAFIIPNPWDAGTAKLLAALGFEALATTSLGACQHAGPRRQRRDPRRGDRELPCHRRGDRSAGERRFGELFRSRRRKLRP